MNTKLLNVDIFKQPEIRKSMAIAEEKRQGVPNYVLDMLDGNRETLKAYLVSMRYTYLLYEQEFAEELIMQGKMLRQFFSLLQAEKLLYAHQPDYLVRKKKLNFFYQNDNPYPLVRAGLYEELLNGGGKCYAALYDEGYGNLVKKAILERDGGLAGLCYKDYQHAVMIVLMQRDPALFVESSVHSLLIFLYGKSFNIPAMVDVIRERNKKNKGALALLKAFVSKYEYKTSYIGVMVYSEFLDNCPEKQEALMYLEVLLQKLKADYFNVDNFEARLKSGEWRGKSAEEVLSSLED